MSFLQVVTTIICEDQRDEPRKKSNLLGVYGVSPLDIIVQDVSKPFSLNLCFFVVTEYPEAREFHLTPQIKGEGLNLIINPLSFVIKIDGKSKRYHLVFKFLNFGFPKGGTYTFFLEEKEQSIAAAQFTFIEGPLND